jgi:CxxH/CxxC protein (TIGR04129 family)
MNSCQNHIEQALDHHLDEFEEMPLMDQLESKDLKCFFCDQPAQYQLSKSGVKSSWE